MKILDGTRTASRSDRPATELLHDESNVRVVAFHLMPGQQVPMHRSPSTVVLQVLEGSGTFTGSDGGRPLGMGETAVFAPDEEHGITAGDEVLRFLAFITPRPGG